MAATTRTVIEAALKEGWTQDNLETQFLKTDKLLEKIGVKDPDELIGEYALTGVHTGRSGGFTVVPPTGSSSTNSADGQKVAQAKWNLRRQFNAIEIDTAAVKNAQNRKQAVVNLVDFEVEGTVSDTRKHIVRQLVTDQSGFITACADNENSTTLKLLVPSEDNNDPYALGVEATRQGWLAKGQKIDVGTAESEASKGDARTIEAVTFSETAPTIKVSGEAIDTEEDGKHLISIANSRSTTTSYSMNGFRNVASTSSKLGEIDPSTEGTWKAAFADNKEGAAISRQLALAGRRKVRQFGSTPDWAWTSLKQVEALENETYPQVRYDTSDQNLGDGEHVMIGNLRVQGHEDVPDGDFTYTTLANVFLIRDGKPSWITQEYNGNILMPQANSTFLYGSLEWFVELGTNKRNSVGQYTCLA